MDKTKVLYVTIPAYDGTVNSFLMTELVKQKQLTYTDPKYSEIDLQIEILNFESLVTRARNTLMVSFMKNTKEYEKQVWLSIDSDIIVSAQDILDMYDKTDKYGVMTYPYRIKDFNTFKIVVTGFKRFPEKFMDPTETDFDKTRIAIVEHAGTGIMAFRKDIIQDIIKWQKEHDLWYYDASGEEHYDVFKTEVGIIESSKGPNGEKNGFRTLLSEDWYICHVVGKELNHPVYCDLYVTTHHITKNFFFTYSPQILYEVLVKQSQTSDEQQ